MIRLWILGGLDLRTADGAEVRSVLAQPKQTALLAYLAAATPRGFHRRDTLLALFWPELDQAHARGALSKAVHHLRRSLGDGVIESRGDEELGVRPDLLWCDAAAFAGAVEAGRSEDALALYRGDLLAGFFIHGAPGFERWLEEERRTRRRAAVDAAWRLAEAAEGGQQGERAAAWARRAAGLADSDEGVVRRVVALLDRVGERAAALRLYQDFAEHLREEWDAEPSAETRALVEKLRSRHAAALPASEAAAAGSWATPAEAVSAMGPQATPLGTLHPRRLAPAFAAVALTTAVVSLWFRQPPAAREASGEPAIAVLPFANVSGQAANDFFADGITGEIGIALGKVEGLIVISRTSVMPYKHTTRPLPEIASELGVGYVLEGSIQRDGGRVRITAQLVDARTDRRLWSERYDRELRDLFAVQTEIAQKIAEALRARVTPEHRLRMAAGGTASVEAYDFYLKGRDHLFRFDGTRSVELATRLLRQALTHDSSYAQAWAVLSFAHGNRAWIDPTWNDSSESAARHAIRLDPNLGEAYAALACALRAQRRFREALPHARRAVELDPNSAAAASILHLVLSGLGRLDEALVWADRAVVLDPTTRDWHALVGDTYLLLEDSASLRDRVAGYTAQFSDRWEAHLDAARWLLLLGDPDGAEGPLRLARTLAPDDELSADLIGQVLVLGRRYHEARAYLQRAAHGTQAGVETPRARTLLAVVCLRTGECTGADSLLQDAERRARAGLARTPTDYLPRLQLAEIYAVRGRRAEAVRALEQAVERGWRNVLELRASPAFDGLREDQGFRRVLARMRQLNAEMLRKARA